MKKLRSAKDIKALYQTNELLQSPGIGVALKVSLMGRGGIRAGYWNRLARLQRKTAKQMTGLTSSSSRIKDMPNT